MFSYNIIIINIIIAVLINYQHTICMQVKEFVNPPPINNFKQSMLNQSESLYHSRKTAPLGMAHDQQAQLPAWINPTHTCFGIETVRDESAAMIVSPQKTRKEVDEEYDKGRDLYKKVCVLCCW